MTTDILGTIITTLTTLLAVYLTHWITQTKQKSEFHTIKVFEPLYQDIFHIIKLAEEFSARLDTKYGQKYLTIRNSDIWMKYTTDSILNLHLQNATRMRKRDIISHLNSKDLMKELVAFYRYFEKYQKYCRFGWPAIEEEIQTYLKKPLVEDLLKTHNIKPGLNLVEKIIILLKTDDKGEREYFIKSELGVTKVEIMETLKNEVLEILSSQELFPEMCSLRSELHVKGNFLLDELRKRMIY